MRTGAPPGWEAMYLVMLYTWKEREVDVRLPGNGNSDSHGARPEHLIITMIKWIRTSRLSIKNSFCLHLE